MFRISQQRFDALGGYCRQPFIVLYTEELDWFEYDDERFLGVLVRDRIDSDFAGVMLARDARGRYRFVTATRHVDAANEAVMQLEEVFKKEAAMPASYHFQGDEIGVQLDLFAPLTKPANPMFSHLARSQRLSPARELIKAMVYYFDDPDKNFVEQFQTTGFDARVWELYLFAAFHEQSFAFDRDEPAPDFNLTGLGGKFFLEAVTINPTIVDGKNIETGLPTDEALRKDYLDNYVPIKYGTALVKKLKRKYWEKPHVADKPLVFAIQDFHYPRSMVWSEAHLMPYLYGQTSSTLLDKTGKHSTGQIVNIKEHKWGTRTMTSNFFGLPEAENISAVLTSSQGTLQKFNRMGCIAHFGLPLKDVVRFGTAVVSRDDGPCIIKFCEDVCQDDYKENWSEGMNVYHNPNAINPLPHQALPLAAHHFVKGSEIINVLPEIHVMTSMTSYGKPLDVLRGELVKAEHGRRGR